MPAKIADSGERNLAFDALKGLAIISVILSHVYRGGTDFLAVFVREIVMWSVPAFFIIQGYFMYTPKYRKWFALVWKKIKKAYLPYIFWAVFYGIYYYVLNGTTFDITDVILGKTALHLYFMFYYILFAMFFPLLYFLPKSLRQGMLVSLIIINIIMLGILEYQGRTGIVILHFSGPNPFKWAGFIAGGMLAFEWDDLRAKIAARKNMVIMLAAICFIAGIVYPYYAGITGFLFNKLALVPMSLGLFMLLYYYYSKKDAILLKEMVYIGQKTFGIYLVHFIFVDPLRHILSLDRFLCSMIILFICLTMLWMKANFMKKYTVTFTARKDML